MAAGGGGGKDGSKPPGSKGDAKAGGKSSPSTDYTKRMASNIQASIEQAHQQQRRELFLKRLEIARTGVKKYQEHNIGDAVKAFHSYIHILEDWKGVAENGLSPSQFDRNRDLPELLLVSGVYWDLTKLYDRTRTPKTHREFLMFLQKYIQFSRGMPFQTLSAETLRKYISHGKPVHKKEFQNAYRTLAGSKCFVATSLVDVGAPGTVPRLRRFRDERLLTRPAGRAFVKWYYRSGPRLVARIDRLPTPFRWALAKIIDLVALLAR